MDQLLSLLGCCWGFAALSTKLDMFSPYFLGPDIDGHVRLLPLEVLGPGGYGAHIEICWFSLTPSCQADGCGPAMVGGCLRAACPKPPETQDVAVFRVKEIRGITWQRQ